jgi:hypothetical protein
VVRAAQHAEGDEGDEEESEECDGDHDHLSAPEAPDFNAT